MLCGLQKIITSTLFRVSGITASLKAIRLNRNLDHCLEPDWLKRLTASFFENAHRISCGWGTSDRLNFWKVIQNQITQQISWNLLFFYKIHHNCDNMFFLVFWKIPQNMNNILWTCQYQRWLATRVGVDEKNLKHDEAICSVLFSVKISKVRLWGFFSTFIFQRFFARWRKIYLQSSPDDAR